MDHVVFLEQGVTLHGMKVRTVFSLCEWENSLANRRRLLVRCVVWLL